MGHESVLGNTGVGLSREGMGGNGKRRGVVMRTGETEKPCGSLLFDKLIRKCKEREFGWKDRHGGQCLKSDKLLPLWNMESGTRSRSLAQGDSYRSLE